MFVRPSRPAAEPAAAPAAAERARRAVAEEGELGRDAAQAGGHDVLGRRHGLVGFRRRRPSPLPRPARPRCLGARDAPEDAAAAAVRYMDDDELNDKMRRAQERLKGLDNHVADLRKRSVEHDAVDAEAASRADSGVPGEGQGPGRRLCASYERQMDVGEKPPRRHHERWLNQHRHGGPVVPSASKTDASWWIGGVAAEEGRRAAAARRVQGQALERGPGRRAQGRGGRPRSRTRRKRPWRLSASAPRERLAALGRRPQAELLAGRGTAAGAADAARARARPHAAVAPARPRE